MASELIDSIFDIAAIEKEKKQVEDLLKDLASTIKTAMDATRSSKSGDDLAKQSKAVNDAMVQGTAAVEKYTAVEKELIKQKQQLEQVEAKRYAVSSRTNKELEENKKLLAEQNQLLKLNTIINDKNTGSLEKAEAENKKLQIEKRKLNLETEEGRKKLIALNAQQDKNNDLMKNSSNKLQEQKIGIGNYKAGFADLTNKFKTGEIGLKGLIKGFFQMGKAVFVALWPLGLVAAALGLLYAVFKNFAPLIDKIEQGFAALTAAWSVLKNSLGQFLSGNQSLKESMSGLGKSMSDAAKDAIELKKAEQDLEDATGGLEVANKKLETQMKSLLLQSKNKTLSEAEQMKLIDQAIALENQQFENKKKINDEELRISQENIRIKNKLTADQYAKLKELGVDYAEELKDQGVQISEADVDRLKAALLANEDIQQESIGIVEKAMNRKDALEEKAAAAQEKRNEKIISEQEKTAARVEQSTANAIKFKEKEADIYEDFVIEETDAEKKKANDLDDLNEAVINNAIAKKKIEYDQKVLLLRKESKNEEDFAAKKFELDKSILQASIDSNKKDLQNAEISGAKRLEIETQLAQAQIDLDNLVLDNFKGNEDEKLNKFLEVAGQINSASMELFGAIADFAKQQSENRLAEIEKEQAANDEYFTSRQKNLDNAIMSDASREQAQKKIDADKAKRDKEIEDKQRAEKIKAAKWDKAQALTNAIINTALAAVKMFADAGPLGFVLAALSTAAGLASIATIASQQIPAYEKGGVTGDGLALWGEKRPEVAVTRTGDILFAERPTISKFDAGTRIYKSVEDFERNQNSTANNGFEFDYEKMGENMPKVTVNLDSAGLWGIVNKQNDRAILINRRYKLS